MNVKELTQKVTDPVVIATGTVVEGVQKRKLARRAFKAAKEHMKEQMIAQGLPIVIAQDEQKRIEEEAAKAARLAEKESKDASKQAAIVVETQTTLATLLTELNANVLNLAGQISEKSTTPTADADQPTS